SGRYSPALRACTPYEAGGAGIQPAALIARGLYQLTWINSSAHSHGRTDRSGPYKVDTVRSRWGRHSAAALITRGLYQLNLDRQRRSRWGRHSACRLDRSGLVPIEPWINSSAQLHGRTDRSG